MSGSTQDRDPGVEQAARSFDAELHTQAYAQTHSDAAQLAQLLAFLVKLTGARAVLEQDKGERIEVTRRALAEAAGTTVETAIRVLRGFQRAGWIDGGVGWVRAVDRDALERVAEGEKTGV